MIFIIPSIAPVHQLIYVFIIFLLLFLISLYYVIHTSRIFVFVVLFVIRLLSDDPQGDYSFSGMGVKTHSTDFSSGKSDSKYFSWQVRFNFSNCMGKMLRFYILCVDYCKKIIDFVVVVIYHYYFKLIQKYIHCFI